MKFYRWSATAGLVIFLATASSAWAQRGPPHIGYVYPAGGQQGATFQVAIGGQHLNGAADVDISGSGVQTAGIEYDKPLAPKEVRELREKIQKLRKAEKDDSVRAEIAEIRKKLAKFFERRVHPVLAETVTLNITIASDAEPGMRELRLAAAGGLSNPLVFQVGQLPEFREQEKQEIRDSRFNRRLRNFRNLQRPKTEPEINVTLPAMLNGQIMPGDVDRYRFRARRGQRLVVAAWARQLIPYLADAVPGWFQAALAIYDAQGNELACGDHYRFHPDPVLSCKIPQDGEYMLEIRDALYRGRKDFVYRIALGELPFVTSVFPLGGPADTPTTVELRGWNLPVHKLTVDAGDKGPGILPLSLRKGKLISNHVPYAVDILPERLEQEPNNRPENAQQVALPLIINGRIHQPGDRDVFRFEGRARQKMVMEVHARRLDSPLDSVLKLTDATHRQLALSDDHGDKGAGLSTHHADSLLMATLPADGAYYLHLGDAQHKGGLEYAYRLRLSAPRPDFALRVVPSSVNARAGASVPITVYALRRDGFSDEIALALKDAPEGFSLTSARVPAGQDQVRLTLTIGRPAWEEPCPLRLEGRARIQGREVLRTAVPADDMMQAFIYRHLVPAENLMVAAARRGPPRPPVKFLGKDAVRIPAGGTAPARFFLPRRLRLNQVQLVLNEPPEGISIQNVSSAQEGMTLLLHTDAEKVKPGLKGNLIVDAFVERTVKPRDGKQQAKKRRIPLGTLPAIPFEIVEQH